MTVSHEPTSHLRQPSRAWRVVGASSAGTAHLESGAPCQDAHAVSLLNESTVVLIAADGSGSASRSDMGSRLATQRMLESIRGFLRLTPDVSTITATIAKSWLKEAAARLAWQAKTDGKPLKDYSCTLLVAIVSASHACFFQVGDGAMLIRLAQGQGHWQTVFWPQHGEFANETFYITNPACIDACEFICRAAAIDEVAVFTDGIETLALNAQKRAPVSAFIEHFFNPVRGLPSAGYSQQGSQELEHYLAAEENLCKHTDDDKTLLMASRLGIAPHRGGGLTHKVQPVNSTDANNDETASRVSAHPPVQTQAVPQPAATPVIRPQAVAKTALLTEMFFKAAPSVAKPANNRKRTPTEPKRIDWIGILLWIGIGVAALVAIFVLQKPPPPPVEGTGTTILINPSVNK